MLRNLCRQKESTLDERVNVEIIDTATSSRFRNADSFFVVSI